MKWDFFKFYLGLRSKLGLPAMTGREIKAYKAILLSFKGKEQVNIFEYGSGFSTIYFARFLKDQGMDFHFHSVDNNVFWHNRVRKMVEENGLSKRVHLYLCPFVPFWEKSGWSWKKKPACGQFAPHLQEEKDYIHLPLTLKKKFDLIVVDGRFRRRCLEVIPAALSEGGVVFLHDAEREHSQPKKGQYPYSRWIEKGKFYFWQRHEFKTWIGSFKPLDVTHA